MGWRAQKEGSRTIEGWARTEGAFPMTTTIERNAPLEWDEVFDCAVAAWCRSSTSQDMLRMCFQSRTQQNVVSVGWTANELMAFAVGVARLMVAPQQPAQEPFGYFRAEPFGWTDCAPDDEGAKALYEHPAPQRQPLTSDAEDAALLRYALTVGGNQRMNWLDVWDDWSGEDDFVDALREAMADEAAHGIKEGA